MVGRHGFPRGINATSTQNVAKITMERGTSEAINIVESGWMDNKLGIDEQELEDAVCLTK